MINKIVVYCAKLLTTKSKTMKNELNTEMIGFKISSEKKEKLDSIANNMGVNSSVLMRQMVDIFITDPFSMVMHDSIIKFGSELANSNYFLYRCNLNALNSIDTDVLDESVKNALIDFINALADSTGQHTISKSLKEKLNKTIG